MRKTLPLPGSTGTDLGESDEYVRARDYFQPATKPITTQGSAPVVAHIAARK
jgi:hypothetical protein